MTLAMMTCVHHVIISSPCLSVVEEGERWVWLVEGGWGMIGGGGGEDEEEV